MDYQRIYNEFIKDRKAKESALIASGEYTEKHHIKPRSLGGTNYKDNMIALTAEDHLRGHLLLAKIHGGKLWAPINILATNFGRRIPTKRMIRLAALARKEHAKTISGENNILNNPQTRRKWKAAVSNPEYRKKLSKSIKKAHENMPATVKKAIAEQIRASKTTLEARKKASAHAVAYWEGLTSKEKKSIAERYSKIQKESWKNNKPQRSKAVKDAMQADIKMREKLGADKTGDLNPSKRADVKAKIAKTISQKRWFTDGVNNIYQHKDDPIPSGFVSGRTDKPGKNAKRVLCIDTGEIFDTITSAAKKFEMRNPSHIGSAARGKRKTAGGYRWAYA